MGKEVENLTMNDFLIISSGTNNIDKNDTTSTVRDIVDLVKNINHTNIIVMGIPIDMI
jgi:RNase H-fold protein (predicted Holliday junction resolvase)